jgi:signal transduction histidine kinase/Na+/proline symporter
MTELALPLLVVTAYVGLLMGVAVWGERQDARGRRTVANPAVYALSLAVYATTWTYYGSVGFAARNGLLFLTVYLGPTVCAALWWWIVRGLVRLKERHRVSGLGDLLALRYARSQRVALLATVVVSAAVVPYLALQLKVLITTLGLVAGGGPGLGYPTSGGRVGPPLVVLMLLFTVAFGLRRLHPTERHPGLVLALAVESGVKLLAFVAVGAFVTWRLFDGPSDLFARANALPEPVLLGGNGVVTWLSHLLLSACAVLLLPRQFHVTVVECADEDHVRTASWLFPAYLLAINLFVLPVALGGLLLGQPLAEADTFVLRLPLSAGRTLLSWLVFLGGFSAAIGMVVVETTALATMVSNHVVIPAAERLAALGPLRRRVLQVRWIAAALVLAAAFGYERLFGRNYALSSIGFVSFAAVLQLVPPLAGGLLWRGASRAGALAGLAAGFLTWGYTLVVPVVVRSGWLPAGLLLDGPFGIEWLAPEGLFDVHLDPVSHAVLWTLLLNVGAFLAGSLLYPPEAEELARTDRLLDGIAPPPAPEPDEGSPAVALAAPKRDQAAALLGRYHDSAAARALADACLARVGASPAGELSPVQLAELQAEVETTLAGAIGTAAAHAALRRAPLVSAEEGREVARAYADILASLNVSPAELQRKIDYHRARERLLARDVANQRFLAGVSGLLGASLELEATARTAVRLPVPLLADAAVLWLDAWEGAPARGWVAHVDAAAEAEVEAALARLAPAAPPVPGAATRDGAPAWPGWPAALPRGRVVMLPLVASRGSLGSLTLFAERAGDVSRGPGRPLPAEQGSAGPLPIWPGADGDVELAVELARRLSLAVENARLYQQAAEAIRLRDEFLAVASHELKTPLTPLRLKIQTLERLVARGDLARVPQEKLAQLFGGAENQVVRLVGLVDDLLDVTRLTTRRLHLRPEPVDLRAMVVDVVERHANDAAQARCAVAIREGPPVAGDWDRLRLEQVLTNLLMNAFKYAPGTRVDVAVEGDLRRARLEVRDEGPGIAPADQERIFRPFERAVRLLEVSGFGLGLYIVRQIVEAHGGTIALESDVGRGTTFRIELPRAAAASA